MQKKNKSVEKQQTSKIDNLLAAAEEYTKRILQSTHQFIQDEKEETKSLDSATSRKKRPGSKRRQSISVSSLAISFDEIVQSSEDEQPQKLFTGQPKCLTKGCKLQPHQLDSLKWMASLHENNMNGILADDMGMGKTIQAIAFLAHLYESCGIRKNPHLIIAPKSTISNWMREFQLWAPFFRVVNLIPTAEHRDRIMSQEMKKGKFDVCITTYEALKLCNAGLRKHRFYMAFFDEAHKLKNADSQVSQHSRALHTEHRILLTGTPLQNDVSELWSLLNFLMPDLFESRDDFKDWFDFGKYDGKDKQAEKIKMVKALHKIMKPFMLRRTKAQLATKLPDKIEINVEIQLTPLQIDVYSNLITQMGNKLPSLALESTSDFEINLNTKNLHSMLMQLRKACQHPFLFQGVEPADSPEYGEHIVEASGKLLFVDKLLQRIFAAKEQCLIFSQFTMVLDVLEDYVTMRGFNYCRLDGSTDLEDREIQIEEFTKKNSDMQVFLISTRAGGLGLNLMTANHVVLYDSDWNPQADLQAMDRAHRIGQKKKVFVYRLICKDTVEEKMIERQAVKLQLDQVVIQQGHQSTSANLSKNEFEQMLINGAAKIMKAKTDKVETKEIDIDKLIQQGEENHRKLKETAEAQISEYAKKSSFNFSMEQINTMQFQDKDYREERQKVQEMFAAQRKEAFREGQSNRRIKRQAAIQAQQIAQKLRTKGGDNPHDPEFVPEKKIKKIIFYEWQFFDNLARLQELYDTLFEMQEKRKKLPDDLTKEYEALKATGFSDWRKVDHTSFLKAFRRYAEFKNGEWQVSNFEWFAQTVEKSIEDCQTYFVVFAARYRELKEKDMVVRKAVSEDFDARNTDTLINYNQFRNYALLLQETPYMPREDFKKIAEQEYARLCKENDYELSEAEGDDSTCTESKTELSLTQRLNHVRGSQPKAMAKEQLKYVATAIRAEKCLREYMGVMNSSKKHMAKVMQEAESFGKSYQRDLSKKVKEKLKSDYRATGFAARDNKSLELLQ